VQSYKHAIRIKPEHADAHYKLGQLYLRMGDRAAALGEYKVLQGLNLTVAHKLFNEIYK
jgi:hypothetical protein